IVILALLGLLPAAGAQPQGNKEEVKKAVIIGGGPVLGVKAAQPGKLAPQVVPGGAILLPQGNPSPTASNPDNELTDAITLPTDREIRKRLEHAQEDYIQNKLWAEACRLLQSVLDSKEDVFVQVRRWGANNQEKMHWTSAKTEANRLIGTMSS